ncbi:MAG: LrgB family protein [Alphaproteobacteria bacterium]|nr:LrgB family protein [Alphaproteobacteria bacterium]
MTDAARLYEVWVYLQAEPLFWLTLTLGCYLLADGLYRAARLFPLLNPVAVTILLVSAVLVGFGIDYERYFNGAKFIHFLLGPATVALAVPIYTHWSTVRAARWPIMVAVLAGSFFAIAITWGLAVALGLEASTIKSLLPRSVTAPIAMGIADMIGGVPSLTAIITIATGITGAALGRFVLDMASIRSTAARGFALGLASHGIGTARAMAKDPKAGVFAAVAMGLSGVVTAMIISLIFHLLTVMI